MNFKYHGFTLIEVLISVLVLAIGVLGLAFLQIVSLKNNQSAEYRTEATVESYSIMDRMRLNREAALSGGYDVALDEMLTGIGSIAEQDITAWKNALSAALPGGDGSVIVDGLGIATVVIQWDDSRGSEGDDAAQLEMSMRL